MTISSWITGVPITQGSMKVVRRGERLALVSDNPKLAAWRSRVSAGLRSHTSEGGRLEGPLTVELIFHLPRPKSRTDDWPSTRPDLDKLIRAILDAATDAGVWNDDGQVCEVLAQKRWAAEAGPGVMVRIHSGLAFSVPESLLAA